MTVCSVHIHPLVRPRSGTKSPRLVMVVCVRVRVAHVVRVSEGTLPTIVNTLRSSKEPLGTIRRNPNYPDGGLPQRPLKCNVRREHPFFRDFLRIFARLYEMIPEPGCITRLDRRTGELQYGSGGPSFSTWLCKVPAHWPAKVTKNRVSTANVCLHIWAPHALTSHDAPRRVRGVA